MPAECPSDHRTQLSRSAASPGIMLNHVRGALKTQEPDFKNAFNEIDRAAVVAAFAKYGTLDDMHGYLEEHLRLHSRIYYLSGGKLVLAEYRAVVLQASEAPGGFCVTAGGLFQEADQTPAEGGGCARAKCDVLMLCGAPVLVLRALEDLKRGAFVRLGLIVQVIKAAVYAQLRAPCLETKPPVVKVGWCWHGGGARGHHRARRGDSRNPCW